MIDGRNDRLSVFVASTFVPEVRAELSAAFDVVFAEGPRPLEELAARAGEGESFGVVLFSLDVPMGAEEIEALPEGIGALATYSVGTDHIDFAAAARRGLPVFNTPGVLGDAVAENALFLMLGAARRATESIDLIRGGSWSGWSPTQLVGVQLSGRTLGILGMGDIGERVAVRAQALEMAVLYCNRSPLPESHPLSGGYRATPRQLVAESDVLLVACPSTEETRGIVNESLLAAAKPGLIVVNIARGDIIHDDALLSALREGVVSAAGLDVFQGEPAVDARYFELPNVFMLPHIGSSTIEARLGMGRILIEGLLSWQRGISAPNQIG